MTVSNHEFKEYEAKYISENESHIYVFIFTAGKPIYIPKNQEFKKEWQRSGVKPGYLMTVRVTQYFASNNDLTGMNKVYKTSGNSTNYDNL